MVSNWTQEQLPNVLIDQKSAIKIGPFGSQLKKELLQKRGDYRVYGQENVYKNDFSFGDRYLSKEKFEDLKSSEICSNDIVISTMGTIGHCAIVPSNILPGVMDSHLIRLRLDNKKVDHLFFKYILQSESIQNQIKKMSVGGIMDGLSTSIIKQIEISYPSINEQKNIAESLSDIDQLINSLSEFIKKKQLIKKGTMQDLINGKKRLNGFEKEWRILKLEKILKIRNGRNQKYIEIKEGKYPILATGGEIGRTNTPIYDKESVLIGRKGTIDRPQYMDTPFWTVDTLFYSELFDETYGKFIFYLFQMIPWRSLNASTGVPSLTSSIIHSVEVKLPELDEQKSVANILSDMDEEIFELEEKLKKYKKIKQGMMEQLLTGKIRLA